MQDRYEKDVYSWLLFLTFVLAVGWPVSPCLTLPIHDARMHTALLAIRRERMREDRSDNGGEDDDDDGMWKEEQSLSTKVRRWFAYGLGSERWWTYR